MNFILTEGELEDNIALLFAAFGDFLGTLSADTSLNATLATVYLVG